MDEHHELNTFIDQASSTGEGADLSIYKKRPARSGYQEVPNKSLSRQNSLWARTVHKLGWFQLAVLVGGNLGLLAGLGTLRYLWPWPQRGESDKSWEAIVFSGWVLRVITLSSIVIRTSITMQATLFSMVMASVALQRSKVIMADAASMSIFRFTNSGPHNLIVPLFRTSRDSKSSLAVIVTALLSITTLASQFTSTILLIDIGTKNLKTNPKNFSVSYGGDAGQSDEFFVGTTASTWDDRPSHFQAFAEKATENIRLNGHKNGGALFATGSSQRALIPLGRQDRLLVSDYEGPAAVIDSRVVCVSPYIMELTITRFLANSRILYSGSEYAVLELNVHGVVSADSLNDYSDELSTLSFLTKSGDLINNLTITFDCRSPHQMPASNEPFPEWEVSLCQISPANFTSTDDTDFYDGMMDLGFVVMNMTGSDESWYNVTVNETAIGFGDESDGEWVKLSYPEPDSDPENSLEISLSLCFTAFRATNALITARADWNLSEPILAKSTNAPRYNTTSLRRHLGVSNDEVANLDHANRGILELVDVNHESVYNLSETEVYITESLIDPNLNPDNTQLLYQYPTARMCIWCYPDIRVHEGFIAIFNDVLATTNHPALALQAPFTARALQIYDDRAPDFSLSEIARVSLVQPFQVPTLMKGFYIVCAVVSFHLVLMMYIIFLFFKIEGQTSLGQAWQTIGQIQGEELKEVIEVSKNSTDREVEKWLEGKGDHNTVVGIREGNIVKGANWTGIQLGTGLGSGSDLVSNNRPQSLLSFRSRVSDYFSPNKY